MVTVANHDSPTWLSSESIQKQSSLGPARILVGGYPKPTIAAPGTNIKAAEANHDNVCPQWICPAWVEQTGTSMAAPHVTGALALLLQRYPDMPLADIHERLRTSARGPVDPSNATTWYRWGAGKLDAQALVDSPWPWLTLATPSDSSARVSAPDASAAVVDGRHPVAVLAGRGDALNAALFSRHLSEVRRLINTNRRVVTLWHRAGGPALLHRLGGRADERMRDDERAAYFERMLGQLTRYGSPALRESIERHGPGSVRMISDSERAT
ncbi:MAG: S8 family serine peptidase [Myxococcales bacterium]|nr:S8 family serine peptidase [Myxococcales bacterium]